jgi:hypothetical protein
MEYFFIVRHIMKTIASRTGGEELADRQLPASHCYETLVCEEKALL